MAKAIADPEELDRFAGSLKRFNATLRDGMARLKGDQARLGESWRDQENERFAREFEQTMKTLEHFLKAADEQLPLLQRKAQRLRDYLEQR